MTKMIFRLFTHGIALAIGFGLGVYFLPILTAPDSPDAAMLEDKAAGAMFSAELTRNLLGSDFLHWGEGRFDLTSTQIIHTGALAPGPDYIAYLTTEFVEDEAQFEAIKASAIQVGSIKTFGGFILDIPAEIDVNDYTTVVVWCESFGKFITAGQYK